MVALATLAGERAVHIVLGQDMGDEMQKHTPEVKKTFVLNNAGLVDQTLHSLNTSDDCEVVLGHLSNLTADKGLNEVLDLARTLLNSGNPTKLIVAGPSNDAYAIAALERAKADLGDLLEYRGPLYGADKVRFFEEISVFVFPTKYRNEASPLVLLEAMAAGVPCLSVDLGCISSDIGGMGGFAFSTDAPFVEAAIKALADIRVDYRGYSRKARERYQELLAEHGLQILALAKQLR